MDLGPHVSFPQMRAKGAPFATPVRKHGSRTLTRFDNCSVELLMELLFGVDGVAFNKYVMNALTRKGSKQELLDLLEFVAGVNRVTSLCGDMRHLPTLIDILN